MARRSTYPKPRNGHGDIRTITVRDVMTEVDDPLRKDQCIDELTALLTSSPLPFLPVVDDDWVPIGVVARTELTRGHGRRVGSLMIRVPFTLQADASLDFAAALMAYEELPALPVVSAANELVGLISALDIMRWLASGSGYVMPAPRAPFQLAS